MIVVVILTLVKYERKSFIEIYEPVLKYLTLKPHYLFIYLSGIAYNNAI